MTVIPFFAGRAWRSAAVVVFADLQMEYVARGRAYAIQDTDDCLANCRRWLAAARTLKLPIVHVRQIKSDVYFNQRSPFSRWIEGFAPLTTEMLYERSEPSCYANEDFDAFLGHIPNPLIVMAGLSGDQACLATAIDAHRRGHRLVMLGDCSASAALGSLSEAASHEAVCNLISRYAEVFTLDHLLDHLDSPAMGRSIAQ